jgi:hypothetical protein
MRKQEMSFFCKGGRPAVRGLYPLFELSFDMRNSIAETNTGCRRLAGDCGPQRCASAARIGNALGHADLPQQTGCKPLPQKLASQCHDRDAAMDRLPGRGASPPGWRMTAAKIDIEL